MKFNVPARNKGHNRQQRQPKQQQQPKREDEEIISISYSDMYTSSTMGEPAYDMEAVQESPVPHSSMMFSTLDAHTETSYPTDVQSVIRNQRCTSEDFDNQMRLFNLLTAPTHSSNSSDAHDEKEAEPSCFGSRWELTVWSFAALFVISVTVILCALLYNRRIGGDSSVTTVPYTRATIPPQWTSSALNATATSP